METTPLLFDAFDAAALLSMPRYRVLRLAKRGELPSVVLPDGEIRFCRADLEAWIAKYRQPSQPAGVDHD